jgi:hypothetical protein
VYCVFDRDAHVHFESAMQQSTDLDSSKSRRKNYGSFSRIPSIPCFELWFLLHFEIVSRECERDEVLQLLRKHLPTYVKSETIMFSRLGDAREQALKNAEILRKRKDQTGNKNPSTDVDLLVNRLLSINPVAL